MNASYRAGLLQQIQNVFKAHASFLNHLPVHPWLTGALGDPDSGVWFVGENPSLGQVERVSDPQGGRPTEEAQWWASKGDRLFRDMLVKHGFKASAPHEHGGWRCYITNVIKEADYAERWRGSPAKRRREAAQVWAPVLRWELEQSKPRLLVTLGKTVRRVLSDLEKAGLPLPQITIVQHYSYVALRPRPKPVRPGGVREYEPPMHPERIREYDREFADVAELDRQLRREV